MERFMNELCHLRKIHSIQCDSKTSEQYNLVQHHKRAETRSALSVEYKVDVEQELTVEAKSKTSADAKGSDPPRSRSRSPNRKKGVVSTLRHTFRSRSRSYCGTRSYKTSDKRGRISYKDRRDGRRSRSRSRYPHGRKERRRSRSSRRHRRGDSYDRCNRRRRSRSRQRRSDSPDRRRTRYSDERSRSRSRSKNRRDDKHRSRRSYSSETNSNQSRNDRSSRSKVVQEKPACSSYDSPKMCATIDHDVTDQTPVQNNFDSRATIEMLRSRIKSTLMNSAAKGNVRQPRDEESIRSRGGINIDYNIFNRVVSTATSTVTQHSNSNIGIAIDNKMQFNASDCRTTNTQSSQFPDVQSVNMNNQTLLDQIRDPRIRKMILASPAVSDQRKPLEKQTSGYWASVHGTNLQKSAQLTYGEYKRQQSRGTASTTDKVKVSKLNPTTQIVLKEDEIMIRKDPPKVILKAEEIVTRKEATEKHAVIHGKRKAIELHEHKSVVPKSMAKAIRKEAAKQAAVRQKCEPNKKIRSAALNEQLSAKKSEQEINTTSDVGNGSSSNQISTLKDLVNPQHLLTLMDLMEQMAENNSLADVREALKEACTNQKMEKDVQSTQKQSVPSGSTSAGYPKKRKNESEKLNEDIDKGRQRASSSTSMTRKNSLAEVKEAQKETCTNQEVTAAIGKGEQPTQKRSVSTRSTPAGYPTKRKNELERLNEDIDNMFIRDGVLNANGRQRASSKVSVKSSMNDAVDAKPKIKSIQRVPSVGPVVICKKEIPEAIPASQKSVNAVKTNELDSTTGTTTVNTKEMPWDRIKAFILLTKEIPAKPKVKNNDPEWHSLKRILPCQICYNPPGVSLVSHYVNFHPNDEVLTSRLAPEAAQHLRSSADIDPCERIRLERGFVFRQFCYFCNTYCSYSKTCWIDHMIRHTGYFHYKCNSCPRKFSSPAEYHACKKRNGVVERIKQPIFRQVNIVAYVCELCNYLRFYEDEIKMHLNNEHEVGDMKRYQEFLFLTFPKMKLKHHRKQKPDICEELEN